MFKKATRMKLRFTTDRGNLSVEDLWDLPLVQLNRIAKGLNKQLKVNEEEDFLVLKNDDDTRIKLQFDIVLDILNTKKAEKDAKENATAKKAEKNKLLAILAEKEDDDIRNMSAEDIRKKIEDL